MTKGIIRAFITKFTYMAKKKKVYGRIPAGVIVYNYQHAKDTQLMKVVTGVPSHGPLPFYTTTNITDKNRRKTFFMLTRANVDWFRDSIKRHAPKDNPDWFRTYALTTTASMKPGPRGGAEYTQTDITTEVLRERLLLSFVMDLSYTNLFLGRDDQYWDDDHHILDWELTKQKRFNTKLLDTSYTPSFTELRNHSIADLADMLYLTDPRKEDAVSMITRQVVASLNIIPHQTIPNCFVSDKNDRVTPYPSRLDAYKANLIHIAALVKGAREGMNQDDYDMMDFIDTMQKYI